MECVEGWPHLSDPEATWKCQKVHERLPHPADSKVTANTSILGIFNYAHCWWFRPATAVVTRAVRDRFLQPLICVAHALWVPSLRMPTVGLSSVQAAGTALGLLADSLLRRGQG